MVDIAELTRTGQLGAIGSNGAGGSDGGGWHPGASTGTIGVAIALGLFGINKSDSNGIAQFFDGPGIAKGDQKLVSWSSKGKEKLFDKILKNAQDGTRKAGEGIAFTPPGGGGPEIGAPSFVSMISGGQNVDAPSAPTSGGSGRSSGGGGRGDV